MSGRHDRSGEGEASAPLLQTGPIVIRGLGRGVKDALRPARTSRHRAAIGGATARTAAAATGTITEPSGSPDLSAVRLQRTQLVVGPPLPVLAPARPMSRTQRAQLVRAGTTPRRAPARYDGPHAVLQRTQVVAAGWARTEPPIAAARRGSEQREAGTANPVALIQRAQLEERRTRRVPRSSSHVQRAQPVARGVPSRPRVEAQEETAQGDGAAVPTGSRPSRSVLQAAQIVAGRAPAADAGPAARSSTQPTSDGVEAAAARIEPPPTAAAPDSGSFASALATPSPVVPARARSRAAVASSRPGAARPLLRDRIGREALGIGVLVVLALVCAGLIGAVVVKTRNDAALAAREAAAYTPPALAAPTTTPSTSPSTGAAADAAVVAVVGDETASSAAQGVTADERWPRLAATGAKTGLRQYSASGAGYAAANGDGDTFSSLVAKVPRDAGVVLFFGGSRDAAVAPTSVAEAASAAFAGAAERAPDAKLVVVGPLVTGASASSAEEVRDAIRGAARVAKATWVDPVPQHWLDASPTGADDLTAGDERAIAQRVQRLIVDATK